MWLRRLSLLIGVFLLCVPVYADSSLGRSSNRLLLTSTDEDWLRDWTIYDSAPRLSDGLRTGYYRRLPTSHQPLSTGLRKGVVIVTPESRSRPVSIVRENLLLENPETDLALGVAANRNPTGSWQLIVKVNGTRLTDPLTISGRAGWQDILVTLPGYGSQLVTIEIEAWASGRDNETVYIDYIALSSPQTRVPIQPNGTYFDAAYQRFLELHQIRERERMQRLLDQDYQDQQIRKSYR